MTYADLQEALRILGLGKCATLKEIKVRHRELVKRHHPDTSTTNEPETIRQVNAAYRVLHETLALFGFGVDSFIEVVSAVGVWHMLRRIRNNNGETRDEFEVRALRITGGAFYLLTAGLALTAVINLYQQHKPETTLWGIVISLLSVSFMWFLIHHKTKVGRALNSPAILADAACSRACVYLSLVLMISSVGYELTGIGSLDAIGALIISWLTAKEGREAFEKASGLNCSCSCDCAK